MTTALSTTTGAAVATVDNLTPERVALLKRTLCPDLNDDEMELFAGIARRAGLDPFAKQIYAMKRRTKKSGTKDQYEEKLTIQTGIDGFRLIAGRTGELDGQDGPFWCGSDGVWKDVWLEKGPPAAAKVIVYRKGSARGFTGVAKFFEYAQCYDGKPSGMWAKMPANQIAKCAEALALRKGFPADLSGLYISEEMDQADREPEPEQQPGKKPASVVQVTEVKPLPALTLPNATAAAKAVEAIEKPAESSPGAEDPVNRVADLLKLIYRKGFDWVGVIKQINATFGTSYNPTGAWDKIKLEHRTAAVAALNKKPDENSAEELKELLAEVARVEGANAEAIFARFCAAAKLPESCVKPDDLNGDQLKTACNSFRTKLTKLKEGAQK